MIGPDRVAARVCKEENHGRLDSLAGASHWHDERVREP